MTRSRPLTRRNWWASWARTSAIKPGVRLLANTIAHQWWGCEISPRTLDDAWITNGMSRYGELMFVEDQSGNSALRADARRCFGGRTRLRHHSAFERRAASIPFRRSSNP